MGLSLASRTERQRASMMLIVDGSIALPSRGRQDKGNSSRPG
jgi:hypothetical protein